MRFLYPGFLVILSILALPSSATAQSGAADPEKTRAELAKAREQLSELAQRIAELSMQLGEPRHSVQLALRPGSQRLMLGILMGPDENSEGVDIVGVTPQGAAEQAGIQAGDRLRSIDGKSLAGNREQQRETIESVLDAHAAGDEVTVEIERDGQRQTLSLALQNHRFVVPPLPPMLELFGHHLPGEPGVAPLPPDFHERLRESLRLTVPLPPELDWKSWVDCDDSGSHCKRLVIGHGSGYGWRLETLNPDLGEYFGGARGVLVLSADPSLTPELKAGDVITEVDGQPVSDREQLQRALADRKAGERVRLEVLRKNRSAMVEVEARANPAPLMRGLHPRPAPAPQLEAPEAPAPPAGGIRAMRKLRSQLV